MANPKLSSSKSALEGSSLFLSARRASAIGSSTRFPNPDITIKGALGQPQPSDITVEKTVDDPENPGGYKHVPALDGVRGVAILLVLVDHLFVANDKTGSLITDVLSYLRASTYCGVNLFFALSGFLITGILLDTLHIPHYFKTFYARRSLRIFPLYYGFLLLLLLLTIPLHFHWFGWQYYYLTYSANLAYLWRTDVPLNLGFFNINHFWSLHVEEQFYLVWPLVVYRVRRPEALARISLITCAVVLCIRIFLTAMRSHHPMFSNGYFVYSPTFSCVDNILFGCGLCAILRTKARATVLRLAPRVFWAAAIILLVVAIPNKGLDWRNSTFTPARIFIPTAGFSFLGVASASVIAMTLEKGTIQSFFSSSVLRFFGKYSYGLYVYHYTISGFLTYPLRLYFNNHFHSKGLSVVLEALIAGVLSVVVAVLSYRLYELKFLHLKRFFAYDH